MPCCHKFADVECGQDKGHLGVHTSYEETSSSETETCFTVREWNDDGETSKEELGAAFPCDYDKGDGERQKIMSIAIADARHNLPAGTVFEIRAKEYPVNGGKKSDWGVRHVSQREMAENWGIAWYVRPKQPKGFEHCETKTTPLVKFATDKGEKDELGGYVLLARIKA